MKEAPGQYLTPAPWDHKPLAFAVGERVVVAGPRSQARHLGRVRDAADKAARIADRYAALLPNPQAVPHLPGRRHSMAQLVRRTRQRL